jgi:hypothetical protein
MKTIKNIHCFLSPMLNESRVLKETKSLIQLGLVDEVRILGYWEKGLDKKENIEGNREILRITTITKKLSVKIHVIRRIIAFFGLIELNIKYLYHIYKYKPDFISCHNLLLLPICVVGKRMTKAKLIYVPHELETEKTGLGNSLKKVSIFIEKKMFKYADQTIVVCEPIADWYKKTYKSDQVFVLRNVPHNPYLERPLIRSRKLREEFHIPDKDIIFIYQGIIDKARGCKEILEVFKMVKPDRHLVMMGYGGMEQDFKEASAKYPNIHFKQAVPINEIINYTSSADIGIFYLPFNISISYKYSMPNKFFEYLMGGLPIAVSKNLEYMSNEIEDQNLGWTLDLNQSTLIDFVNSINIEAIKKKHVKQYADKSGWQLEHAILKTVYQK